MEGWEFQLEEHLSILQAINVSSSQKEKKQFCSQGKAIISRSTTLKLVHVPA